MHGMKSAVPMGSRRLMCVAMGAGSTLRWGGFQKNSMKNLLAVSHVVHGKVVWLSYNPFFFFLKEKRTEKKERKSHRVKAPIGRLM